VISLPPKGDTAKKLGAYFTPLKVEAQSTPNMTVKIAEGAFWTADTEFKEYVGGTSPTISAPSSNAKWVLVTVTANGQVSLINGTAGANPDLPAASLYADKLPLAAIFVGDTTTAITNDMIYDLRPMWQIQPDSVSQSQLSDYATTTYVDNSVATKADTDGTNSADFTLNVGGGSTNTGALWFDRFSGPDVGIRFNEIPGTGSPTGSPATQPAARWEFTNDGVTWNPIGFDESSGNYYTKANLDGGALDARYYTQTEFGGAVGVGVLDSRYYTETEADANFAPLSHTHEIADITDFTPQVQTINSLPPTAGNINLYANSLLDVTSAGAGNKHVLVHNGTIYVNRFLTTDDLSDVDTTSEVPTSGDALMHNGISFVSRPLVKLDISDFTGAEFVLVTNVAGDMGSPPSGTDQNIWGVKTFKEGIVVEQSLTVTGDDTSIETTELYVKDDHVILNYGETGAGVGGGAGTAGIRIDRGIGSPDLPDAILQWDENAGQWEFGVVGSAAPVLTANHNHVPGDINGLSAWFTAELGESLNTLDKMADVFYHDGSPPLGNKQHLLYNGTQNYWENKDFATSVTNELTTNNLNTMADVEYHGSPALAEGQVLIYEAVDGWSNHNATKSIISDFSESDYIHVTGNETKNGNLIINGDFTVGQNTSGSPQVETTTILNSVDVRIKDNVTTINYGDHVNLDLGSGTAGFAVDRGSLPQDAFIQWNESSGVWEGSRSALLGSPLTPTLIITPFSYTNHQHTIDDLTDISADADEINTLDGIDTSKSMQTHLDERVLSAGDTMDLGADLTFNNGEVLGLPATPSVDDAAASKLYVDTEAAAVQAALHAHAIDTGSPTVWHMTADQNAFLDTVMTGSPTLAGGEVNTLSGIDTSTTVQAQLDDKISRSGEVDSPLARSVMDAGISLQFSGGGEVLGMPASPSATAAASKEYVDTQVARKIDRAGETGSPLDTSVMDSGISLTFSGGGEVLGLPASPSATGAASKEYVDTLDTAQTVALTAHIDETGSPVVHHMTPEQNAFLDGLNITGSPETLTAAHVNFLSNVTSNVQDQLDLKANFINHVGSPVGSPYVETFVSVAINGDIQDSTYYVDDTANTTSNFWTADKVDTTKANKVVGSPAAVAGNFAGLDAAGDLTDSGSKAADFATAGHTHANAATAIDDWAAALDTYFTGTAILSDLSDVVFTGSPSGTASANDFMQFNGTNWVNITPTDIDEFVHATGSVSESITGTKTFTDIITFSSNVIVNADMTVAGTTTFIDSTNLEVTDKQITVNKGYNGPTSGSTGAGIYVVRDEAGSPVGSPDSSLGATLIWDDSLENFKAGLDGSETELARVGLTPAQPAYDIQTGQGGSPTTDLVYTLTGSEWNIPAPAANHAAIQIFVNGIKQTEGAGKAYTVAGYGTGTITITFNAGSEPAEGTDVEFYGFGYIG